MRLCYPKHLVADTDHLGYDGIIMFPLMIRGNKLYSCDSMGAVYRINMGAEYFVEFHTAITKNWYYCSAAFYT